MEEVEPAIDELAPGAVRAFQGLGARPNGKAYQSDSSMLVEGETVKKSALQWKLRFDRFDGKQPTKEELVVGQENVFKAFEGGGSSLRKK